MRYLACIRPNGSLVENLMKEPKMVRTDIGLHCTLWGFNTFEYYESELVESFSKIMADHFSTSIFSGEKFKNFDSELNSYVLLLLKNPEFCGLHAKILNASRGFDKEEVLFDRMVRAIGNSKYNPHIALPGIVKSSDIKDNYIGKDINVSSYELLKKKGTWKHVHTFDLK